MNVDYICHELGATADEMQLSRKNEQHHLREAIEILRHLQETNAALKSRLAEVERYMNGVCEALEEPAWDNAYDAARMGMLANKRLEAMTSDDAVECVSVVVEEWIDKLEHEGFVIAACDSHGRDHIMADDDGIAYCSECSAEGFTGELSHLSKDSEAIAITRKALAAARAAVMKL